MQRRKIERKKVADSRVKVSPSEQLKRLDDRLGVGLGAVKERARLQKMIE